MDLNNDGIEDVITGSYTGELYIFRGSEGGLSNRDVIRDKDGKIIEAGHSVTVEAHDLDGDGDLDLLIGQRTDSVFWYRNVGTEDTPAWSPEKIMVKDAAGEAVKGSNAHLADWDADGLRDLIVGSENGAVMWYRNTADNAHPSFGVGVPLVHEGAFSDDGDGPPSRPGRRVKSHVVDWNGDGRLDLLVGDVTWEWRYKTPLTAEESAELERLMPAVKAVRAKADAMGKARTQGKRAKTWTKQDQEALLAFLDGEYARVMATIEKFEKRKTADTHGWVWLYERLPNPTTRPIVR